MVDDWIETGEQIHAAIRLIRKQKGKIAGIVAINRVLPPLEALGRLRGKPAAGRGTGLSRAPSQSLAARIEVRKVKALPAFRGNSQRLEMGAARMDPERALAWLRGQTSRGGPVHEPGGARLSGSRRV